MEKSETCPACPEPVEGSGVEGADHLFFPRKRLNLQLSAETNKKACPACPEPVEGSKVEGAASVTLSALLFGKMN